MHKRVCIIRDGKFEKYFEMLISQILISNLFKNFLKIDISVVIYNKTKINEAFIKKYITKLTAQNNLVEVKIVFLQTDPNTTVKHQLQQQSFISERHRSL